MQPTILNDLAISEGPCQDPNEPCSDTLSFRFEDPDSYSGRVRATITPNFGLQNPRRIIPSKFYVAPGDTPIRQHFKAERGNWTLDLCVWDTNGDSASAQLSFEALSSASGSRMLVPELSLSRGHPNPSRGRVSWELHRSSAGEVDLRVIAVDGRCLRSWTKTRMPAGTTRLLWDGLDQRGVPAPSGRYYMVATDASGETRSVAATLIR